MGRVRNPLGRLAFRNPWPVHRGYHFVDPMRTLLASALLVVSAIAAAQDAPPKPIAIALQPLGDRGHGVVAEVSFRFANPRAITEAGLFLEGSFKQAGHVPRNFRVAVPRKNDRGIWNNAWLRNGKTVRVTRWALLPDKRNEAAMVHLFDEGPAEIDVQLVLEADYGGPPRLIATATETFTLAKTNRPLPDDVDFDEPAVPEAAVPEEAGAVTIRIPPRKDASSLFPVSVDVLPPVKRVEFWVESKRILARNAPPYTVELDLGGSPDPVALRAIGYDASGRYIDADAFVVNEDDPLVVKITRIDTSDGLSHFKLSIRNPKKTQLKSIVLYAGDKKLHEWSGPPFALSVSTASLAGVDSVRASVIDETGYEASDLLRLGGGND